ncbi:MAG: hypothetical protein ABR606_03275 [Vicinamibacterales bacterium]
MNKLSEEVERRVLKAFHRAASDVKAYRTLLDEREVEADSVVDLESFSRVCPLLSKENTFDRFPLDELCGRGSLEDLLGVLTSSGHGGRFSFGLISRSEAKRQTQFVDHELHAAFQVRGRSTLAINCLPMGVGFSSNAVTVATTSVREDMAVALVTAFGKYYEQLLLIGDPLFMTKLVDYSARQGVEWGRYRVNVVLGEEIFGEHFRDYVADRLRLDLDHPDAGYIMSSFGVGELGLNLCHETRATVALRRAAFKDRVVARELLGVDTDEAPPPLILTFEPLRLFVEVIEPDGDGYGSAAMSMLDPETLVPLLRYQTGDVIRLLDPVRVNEVVRRLELSTMGEVPPNLLALKGRRNETLPNGSHVGVYKDALYADREVAPHITGAFRLIFTTDGLVMHIQLAEAQVPRASLEHGILQAIPIAKRPARLVFWPYRRFPFGMTVDYERKFSYYVAGEADPPDN